MEADPSEIVMTKTEFLLSQAHKIAQRAFDDPTEGAVIEIFRRLCCEYEEAQMREEINPQKGALH
jgi:hypothetical protein